MRTITFIVLLVGVTTLSCIDPNHSDAVDALGPEVPGVRQGPTHRAGQPCTTCHGSSGPGEPQFVVGGTIYDREPSATTTPVALEGVTISLRDIKGSTKTAISNQVGNFYVTGQEWQPTYPIFVSITYGDKTTEMTTRIGRNGGCASCHVGAGDNRHMPLVYLKKVADP